MMVLHRAFSYGATRIVAASDSYDKSFAAYICDGTDDDVEIQAAIDDLPAGGGSILLLDGTFLNSATVNVNKPCIISGVGPATVVKLADTTNVDIFTLVADQEHVTIRDLNIDGNSANNATDGNGIYATDGNRYCTFENLEVYSCREYGISVSYVATRPSPSIINCEIHDCIAGGMVTASADDALIEGCRVHDNTITGIWSANCERTIIRGNTTRDNTYHGIYLSASNYCTVVGNTSYSNTQEGIYLSASHNNTVNGNTSTFNTKNGIYLRRSSRNTVNGNTVAHNGNTYDGIRVLGDGTGNADYNEISNNNAFNGVDQEVGVAIVGGTDANSNQILGNTCIGNVTDEIADAGTNTQFSHNVTS